MCSGDTRHGAHVRVADTARGHARRAEAPGAAERARTVEAQPAAADVVCDGGDRADSADVRGRLGEQVCGHERDVSVARAQRRARQLYVSKDAAGTRPEQQDAEQ